MRKALLVMAALAAWTAATTSYAAMTHNRLASNRLASNRLAANKLASSKLSVGELTAACSVPPASCSGDSCYCANPDTFADLVATAEGQELLTYIISCALPLGTTVIATHNGDELEFFGGLGLAPGWLDHRLKKPGQGWVSACLFTRVNDNNVTTAISIRGPSPALATDPNETASWNLEEGAFYGQYFTPNDQPMIAIACRGRDKASSEAGGLADRDCAEPDPLDPTHTQCGFTFAGDCADFTPETPSAYVCKKFGPKGFYTTCHNTAGLKKWPHGKKYKQVITTFVAP